MLVGVYPVFIPETYGDEKLYVIGWYELAGVNGLGEYDGSEGLYDKMCIFFTTNSIVSRNLGLNYCNSWIKKKV